ncbi:MAG: acyltransferase [Methylococcales bacterium]
MRYRPEIDGLRAVAVIPVIMFHAGYKIFSGGFVGVDIFFVISGYLITTIIISELDSNNFSILSFYERRMRRILPALFLVMGVSSILSYFLMLPDELENFGQSVVATTLFSNNILLVLTSGYWSLESEFKPLLHTWSLGVEEQYYIIFPIFLIMGWRHFKKYILSILLFTAILSICAAQWGAINKPEATFYLLPTRGWELLLGSFAGLYLIKTSEVFLVKNTYTQLFSLLGFILVFFSFFSFSGETPNPSFYTLVPTIGVLLIILFAKEGTFVNVLLSSRPFVGIGLISYSAYLWHFPVFAFMRIYSVEPPSSIASGVLCILTIILAYISWKFIEKPFRTKGVFSRTFVFIFSLSFIVIFVGYGYFLHKNHGIPTRMYSDGKIYSNDMYISYNEKAFRFKKNLFEDQNSLKILILGNSFGRDFVNMTTENFTLNKIEIVYRDDFDRCFSKWNSPVEKSLLNDANVIVFASVDTSGECVKENINLTYEKGKNIFYVGTKHFGYNLNWIVRLDSEKRRHQYNPLLLETLQQEEKMTSLIPKENYLPLLSHITNGNLVPITDEEGKLISPDRKHLTKYGAQFIGRIALVNSSYGNLLQSSK